MHIFFWHEKWLWIDAPKRFLYVKSLGIYRGLRQRSIFTVVFESTRYLPWFSKTRSFPGMQNHICSIFIDVLKHTRKTAPLKKLWHRKGFCTLDPCFIDIYRKHPYIHLCATISFWCVFVDFPYFVGVCHAFWPWGGPKSVRLGTLCAFRRVSLYVWFACVYRANLVIHTKTDARIHTLLLSHLSKLWIV